MPEASEPNESNELSLPERLKRWRKRRRFTQREASEFFGVPFRTYTDVEYGEHLPTGFGLSLLQEKLATEEKKLKIVA